MTRKRQALGLLALVGIMAGCQSAPDDTAAPIPVRESETDLLDAVDARFRPMALPNVPLTNLSGSVVPVDDGTSLVFVASWCLPCRKMMMDLETEHAARTIVLFLDDVSPDTMRALVRPEAAELIDRDGARVLSDSLGGVMTLPTVYRIQGGRVVSRKTGYAFSRAPATDQ